MKPETLQTYSQIAILVGIVVTALGTYGSYHFGNVVEKAKERASAEREERFESNISELLAGNEILQERLEPFEELAKRVHPALKTDEALDELRRDLERLERQAAPRSLSDSQVKAISTDLRQPGSRTLTVSAVMGDQEAFQFALALKSAIEAGGWNVEGVNQVVFSDPLQGLVISVGKDDPPPATANELFKALRIAGLTATGNLDPKHPKDAVTLIVGSK